MKTSLAPPPSKAERRKRPLIRNSAKAFISFLKDCYHKGMKIRLLKMDNPQAPPAGTIGVIQSVDNIGNILVFWSSGCTLSLIPKVNEFEEIVETNSFLYV